MTDLLNFPSIMDTRVRLIINSNTPQSSYYLGLELPANVVARSSLPTTVNHKAIIGPRATRENPI